MYLVVLVSADGQAQSLTYQELNRRANRIAHQLQSCVGEQKEILVGICLERSLELVIALLGVLKAGGAYVPLDPAYPAERLHSMLQDSRAALVLTQEHLRERLALVSDATICLDRDQIALLAESNLAIRVSPDRLASRWG